MFWILTILNRCVRESHCNVNWHFPDERGRETSFHVLICHLYIFFYEVSVKSFGYFFNQVVVLLLLSIKGSLYI